jgi:hypothetical protein
MAAKTESATAQGFEPNKFYDRLIVMRRTDRQTFDGFSIPTRLALEEYEKRKREHEQTQGQERKPR